MKMDRTSWLTIVILASAAINQFSEAKTGCPKYNPTTCTVQSDCNTNLGFYCAGPVGKKVCSKCKCNKDSECSVVGNDLKCSCSAGYTGEHCECLIEAPPDCTDKYLVRSGNCEFFSNDFLEINSVSVANVDFPKVSEYEDEDECKNQTIREDCRGFKWGKTSHICYSFWCKFESTRCVDPYLIHTDQCSTFSNRTEDILAFSNTKLQNVTLLEDHTAHEEEDKCIDHCIKHGCQVYQWSVDSHYCSLYGSNEQHTYILKEIFENFKDFMDYKIGIRKCDIC